MKNFYPSSFRINVAALLVALLFIVPQVGAKPKSYAEHTAEITRLAQANEAGQVLIEKGDALTPIAQRYATANDLPLDVALKKLIDANPEAFEDAQKNLKIGALLIIPKKLDDQTTSNDNNTVNEVSVGSDVSTSDVSSTPAAEPTLPPLPTEIVPAASTQTDTTTVPALETVSAIESFSFESAVASAKVRLQALSEQFYMPPWAWVLLGVVVLMLLTAMFKRGKRDTVNNNPKDLDRHENGAPKVVLFPSPEPVTSQPQEAVVSTFEHTVSEDVAGNLAVNHNPKELERHANGAPKVVLFPQSEVVTAQSSESTPVSEPEPFSPESTGSVTTAVDDTEGSLPHEHNDSAHDEDEFLHDEEDSFDDEPLVMHEKPLAKQDERFELAVSGLSSINLDLNFDKNHAEPNSIYVSSDVSLPEHHSADNKPASVTPTSEQKIMAISASQNLKSASFFNHHFKTPHNQLAKITNFTARAITFANVKAQAMASVQQVAPEVVSQIATPELDVDVPTFLREYSHNLPEPTFTSVDYEDLLDKARLQAWLNVHSVDDILLYAQDAHDARYDDVAQLMLNDVLLRGNADQCAAVLNLRYLWSYPQGVS